MNVLIHKQEGIYCPEGQFHIDPSRAVETALITHAHTDHVRKGSKHYICAKPLEGILRHRVGNKPIITAIPYHKKIKLNNTTVSFHPAGHMLGSAQIKVETNNEVWVVSGDYKRDKDPTCDPFEPLECDVFITEATFGHPKYIWPSSESVMKQIKGWWNTNQKQNTTSILYCYSLGKAQRILGELYNNKIGEIFIHEAMAQFTQHYRDAKVKLAPAEVITSETSPDKLKKALIIAPPSNNADYIRLLQDYETAAVSGWTLDKKFGAQGFTLSDHADWPALLKTIEQTKAKRVFVTHGDPAHLVSHLTKLGISAQPFEKPKTIRTILEDGQYTLKRFFS
jgi:putative mRNA 3-end processing factor